MKGIVFTELLEMVESNFGYEMVDTIINENELDSEGIYTAVGTYQHHEMVSLLTSLSNKTSVPIPSLLHLFGRYLFDTFTTNYKEFFDAYDNAFDFLNAIETHIHVEVLKLYPDAELPKFKTTLENNSSFQMLYTSERKMSSLALGLIEKSLEYYGESNAEITIENLDENGKEVLFIINKTNG
jgi:hypothetical protein